MTIAEVRAKRADLLTQLKAISTRETAGETLTADDLAQFSQLEGDINAMTARIDRLETAEQLSAQLAQPVAGQAPAIHIKREAAQYQGAGFARIAMAMAAGAGDLKQAADFAATEIGDAQVAMALNTAAGSGGALIPENLHNEVIELLRPKTIVRALGARVIPLPNGNLTLPRLSGGATATYVGEGVDVRASQSSFDDVKLSAKTIVTLVPMSNQLIGRAGFNVEQIVLGDILAAMAVREDKAFLRDDGTSATPKGFKAVATEAGRTRAWAGTADVATIDAYLDGLILMLMASDSMLVRPGWGLSPRSYMKLFGLRDGNGNKVYPELAQGLLKGYPIAHTNTIPSNLGTGSNESEIYFADFNDIVIGEQDTLSVDYSNEAAYVDANGELVSVFSRNQSLIRLVGNHDIGFRHPEGLALGTGVTW
ncbi:MAG: phage major capsid protein [Aeromonas sp.]